MATGLTVVFCALILCLGVFCFFALWYYKRFFTDILKEVQSARQEVSRVGQKVDAQGTFEEKMTVLTTFDNIKLERARNEYDSKYSVYVFWSQMVPLFSSLGLLGTVLGLILSSSGDIEIFSSSGTDDIDPDLIRQISENEQGAVQEGRKQSVSRNGRRLAGTARDIE